MIAPLVTDTVIGTLIVMVPSDTVSVVEPLAFEPIPIEVATKMPVDAGVADVETATDAGDTVTIVVSLLTAVNVPLKPFSVTLICWLPFTPPNATFAGVATSGIGVGVGEGVGVGATVAVAVAPGEALDDAVAVDEADGTVDLPPPPPQPANMANAAIP